MTATTTAQKKSIHTPDETRQFDNGRIDIVTLDNVVFIRTVFQPGWKWSESVKPIARTESCELQHAGYVASGSLHIRMDSGEELDVAAGDVFTVAPGHDAWVAGEEPCVMYDVGGDEADYAKPTA